MRIQLTGNHQHFSHKAQQHNAPVRHDVMLAVTILTGLIMVLMAYLWYAAAHYAVQYNPAYDTQAEITPGESTSPLAAVSEQPSPRAAATENHIPATRDAILQETISDKQ